MSRPTTPAGEIGAKMAEVLATLEEQHAEAAAIARRRLLAPREVSRRTRTTGQFIALIAACGMVLCVVVWLSTRAAAPLSFRVDGAPADAAPFIAAPSGRPVAVQFSDGSNVDLKPDSGLRVLEAKADGARILLERGGLRAAVVHRGRTDWRVIAGPFAVRVVGTIFEVDWDPVGERLAVGVTEGRVVVRGAAMGEREVSAGHTLRVHLGETSVLMDGDSASPQPPALQPGSDAPGAEGSSAVANAQPVPSSATPPLETASTVASPSWRGLADSGRFREALAAADAAGFDAQCAQASAADLLVLSDVARLGGKPDASRRALLALRRRFPGDRRGAVAAFMLAKVSLEKLGDVRQGVDWLRTCLREQPGGAMAREAQGRLLEALRKLGDSRGARAAAREYLDRYPGGPHASVAQAVLAE